MCLSARTVRTLREPTQGRTSGLFSDCVLYEVRKPTLLLSLRQGWHARADGIPLVIGRSLKWLTVSFPKEYTPGGGGGAGAGAGGSEPQPKGG